MYFTRYTGYVPGVGAYSVVSYFGDIVCVGTFRECQQFVQSRRLA